MHLRFLLARILACATLLADGLKAVPGNTDLPSGRRDSTDVDLYRPPTPEELDKWKNMDVDSIVNRLGRHKKHEHILFVGDSVMRNMQMFLAQLIDSKNVKNIEVSIVEGTWFRPHALQEKRRGDTEYKNHTPFTAIVFDANLHLLHLEPSYVWTKFELWMNYMSDAAKTIDKYHEDAPSARLIPTFMNALCPDRWFGPMKNTSDAVQAHERAPVGWCVEFVQQYHLQHNFALNVSPEDLAVQCSKSWISNDGIEFLNEQLRSATNKWSKDHESVRVDLWDRYATTHGHCADTPSGTTDGIHWLQWADKEALALLDALQWL